DVYQCIGARRPWRIAVEPSLGQLPPDLLVQPEEEARPAILPILPVGGLGVRDRRALEVFHFSDLGGALRRVRGRGPARRDLARRGQHEGLPAHLVDPARLLPLPEARTDRYYP